MTDVLTRSLPSPRNWQDFERLAFDLYRRLWNADDIELNGRAGQAQSGVDVYGTDYNAGGGTHRFVGIQCKGKDADYGHAVSEKELRAEVDKALTFQPPLDLFILVTTAPNDVSLQAVARSISADHRKAGKFAVQVKGWDTLRQLITDFPDLVSKHFQDFAPYDLLAKFDEMRVEMRQAHEQNFTLLTQKSGTLNVGRDGNDDDDPLAKSIMTIADQIGDGSPIAALKALERMLNDHAATASKLALFRIFANIGNAHMTLGHESDAINSFRKAYAAHSDYPNARATLAVAKALEGDRDGALTLGIAALADDPSSRRAAGVILDFMPKGTSMADVEAALTPEVLGHFEIKIGLSIRAHREGDFAVALRFAEEAYKLKPNDWRTNSSVAEALLAPLASNDLMTVTGVADKTLEAALDRAINLNRKAWGILVEQDSSFQGRHVAANLVSQLLLIGEDVAAWEVLEQALANNSDFPPLLQRQAQRFAGEGNWNGARQAIQKIPSDQRLFEDQMLLMHCALNLKNSEAALALVPKLAALAQLPEQAEFAAGLAVDASLLGGGDPTVTVEAALDAHPQSVILRSMLLESPLHSESVKARIVEEIDKLATDKMSPRARVLAAEAMMDVGKFSKAADLYAPLQGHKDSSALFRRMQALHLAGRRKEARSLYESLPGAVRRKDRYIRLGIAIYEQAGLLKPAVRLLEESLAATPRLGERLHWIQMLVRLGETRHIDWLRNVPSDVEGSALELTSLAQFVDKFLSGDSKALELGYRALRAGYGDAQVHLGFAFGLFFQGSGRRDELKAPATVEPGAGVVLVDDVSGEALHYIIEPRADAAAERGELAPDHPVAKDLIGKAIGETIIVRKIGPANQNYRIADVQNGYVFAFQRTLREFHRLFPGNPAFGSVLIDESKDPDERFEPVFAMVRDRAEQTRNLEEIYESGPMPLFMLARFSGVNLFDLWEGLRLRPDKYLKVSLGIAQEFELGRIAADVGLVLVDPLAIYAWTRLGIANDMLSSRQSLGVVQSSIDMLRQLHAERLDQRGNTFSSMVWDGERYHMTEVSAVEIERRIADAEAAANFASQLVLVPAESPHLLRDDIASLLSDVHPAFADTFLAGMQDKRGLLTDDLGLRAIAQESGIPCTWTQPYLQILVSKGTLTPEVYRTALITLVESRYDFTQLGHAELLAELRTSGWVINGALRRFAALMVRPNVDRESLATVLAKLAIEGRQGEPPPSCLAAFHVAIVEAFKDAGAVSDVVTVYKMAFSKMESDYLKFLVQQNFRQMLLLTTAVTKPKILVQSLERKAKSFARETWQILVDGGLRVLNVDGNDAPVYT